jgi:segregation and condensation protein B
MIQKQKSVISPEADGTKVKDNSLSDELVGELIEADGRLSEIIDDAPENCVATCGDVALEGLLDQGDLAVDIETSEVEDSVGAMDLQEDKLWHASSGDEMSSEDQAEIMADTADSDVAGVEAVATEEVDPTCVVEAVLFAADEAFSSGKLATIVDCSAADIEKMISELNKKYEKMGCAFSIEAVAGGFQMLTNPKYHMWLVKLLNVRNENKLSAAAMETLAIIAYKQPVMRVDIENIRGVACGEMIRQLSEKGLVKIAGRAEELGRPILYGTTKKFLEIFGLCNLKELPDAQDGIKPEGA